MTKKRLILNIVLLSVLMIVGMQFISYSLAEEYETYNTSILNISVYYYEMPVDITRYTLVRDDGYVMPIKPTSPLTGMMNFSFRTGFLDNGIYRFTVDAVDIDGNPNTKSKDFIVDRLGMKVWLIDPPLGIGTTPTYNITVGSQYRSNCRYYLGEGNASCEDNSECMYKSTTTPFTQTGDSTIHNITNFYIPGARIWRNMGVACLITGADPKLDSSYGHTSFIVGYDDTDPIILSINASKKNISYVNDRTVRLQVRTDKPTACSITGGNIAWSNVSKLFDGENMSRYSTYNTLHNTTLAFDTFDPQYTMLQFNYGIRCYSVSQLYDEEGYNITYLLDSTIIITSNMPSSVQDKDITYVAETNIPSDCRVALNGHELGDMTQDSTKTTHSKGMTLNAGDNQVNVSCYGYNYAEKIFHIFVDESMPVLTLKAGEETCGLSKLTFTINATDPSPASGIKSYSYKVENSTGLLLNWSESGWSGSKKAVSWSHDLVDGETYDITAFATDNAGWNSTEESVSMIAHDSDSIACDNEPPHVSIHVISSSEYKAEVNMSCYDERECSEDYDYSYIMQNESCDDASYTSKQYDIKQEPFTSTFSFTEKGTLCIIVYDKRGNNASASKTINLQQAECGNGVKESVPEQGYYEQCDQQDFAGVTCKSFDHFEGGILRCDNTCHWDTSNCAKSLAIGYCGDNKINNFPHEQCDGNGAGKDWGNIKSCSDFGFKSGTLTCTNDCVFNTSDCVAKVSNPNPSCNGITTSTLDAGEQCETTLPSGLTCKSFDHFDGGKLSCLGCFFDISGCISSASNGTGGNNTQAPQCGDGIIDPGEQCDGTDFGITDWAKVMQCDNGIQCTNDCQIECASQSGNASDQCGNGYADGDETGTDCGGSCPACPIGDACTKAADCLTGNCNNGICGESLCEDNRTDGDETDVDCGGSCKACDAQQKCKDNADCSSGICKDDRCAIDPCANGVQDNDETGTDCGGGSCAKCSENSSCKVDDDCLSGSCKGGVCVAAKEAGNVTGLIILLLGVVITLGSGGYILYNTYYKKPEVHHAPAIPHEMPPVVVEQANPHLVALQQQRFAQKKEEKSLQRRAVISNFESDSKDAAADEKIKLPRKAEEKQEEYVDLSTISKKPDAKQDGADVFKKLSGMTAAEQHPKTKPESRKTSSKDSAFARLNDIAAPSQLAKRISSLVGTDEAHVTKSLGSGSMTVPEATRLFEKLDHAKLLSAEFKGVLKDLVDSGKLSRESASSVLFEFMDRGLLSKSDVARIADNTKIMQ